MTAIDIATARAVLQVLKNATKKDIERAFRNLSKKLHPDRLSEANRTAEANERFAEASNAKDLLLRHLDETGGLSPSSCCNVPKADPPIPRKSNRESASRSAPRKNYRQAASSTPHDKENKPFSSPYSAEQERKEEEEFKDAWRKVCEIFAREKNVPYEDPFQEAVPKAREKSKKPSTTTTVPSKKGVQAASEKVAAAPSFKNGTVKVSVSHQKKPLKKPEDPFQEAVPKAREKSKKHSTTTTVPSKKGVQVASEKVAAAPSKFKNGTVEDSSLSPQKKPLKKARIIEDVDDSLPHPKKPVKMRRFIVEDEDSSDGSCCTSSKSYINSCATYGNNQAASEKVAAAPSIFKNGTVEDSSLLPQKEPLKKALIIEDVDDSLPHPKKPVKMRRFIVEDEDSSDGSCCTSSKSYINSCATYGNNGGDDGKRSAQTPSSNSHGSRGWRYYQYTSNSSNSRGGNGGWGHGGPPSTPPPGGGGRNNGGSCGYPPWNRPLSTEGDNNKRKYPFGHFADRKRSRSSPSPPLLNSPNSQVSSKWGNSSGWGSSLLNSPNSQVSRKWGNSSGWGSIFLLTEADIVVL